MIKDVKDYIGRMNIRGIVDRAVAGRSRASSSTIYDKYFSDVHRLCLLRRCLRGLEWEGRLARKLYVSKGEVYRDDL